LLAANDKEIRALESSYPIVFNKDFDTKSLSVIAKSTRSPHSAEVQFLSAVFHLKQAVRAADQTSTRLNMRSAITLMQSLEKNNATYFSELVNALLLHKVDQLEKAIKILNKPREHYGLAYYMTLSDILSGAMSQEEVHAQLGRMYRVNQSKNAPELTLSQIKRYSDVTTQNIKIADINIRNVFFHKRNDTQFMGEFVKRFRSEPFHNQNFYYKEILEALKLRGSPKLYEVAGDLAFHLGSFDQSADHYSKATQLDTQNGVLWHKHAVAALEDDKPVRAEISLLRAQSLRPDDHSVMYNLACALSMQKKLTVAESTLRQAWEMQPEYKKRFMQDPQMKHLRNYIKARFVAH
jgi:Flp pilus assembly protein TadD